MMIGRIIVMADVGIVVAAAKVVIAGVMARDHAAPPAIRSRATNAMIVTRPGHLITIGTSTLCIVVQGAR
jgi:hypothetical protein